MPVNLGSVPKGATCMDAEAFISSFAFFFCSLLQRRCVSISTKDLMINEQIKAPQVRLVGVQSEQIGIVPIDRAQAMAEVAGLDLVLMAPGAVPPVCRIMDYGKYRFDRDKKEKEAKKKQQIVKLKEVQLSCTIDTHDFNTRVNQALRFLSGGNKVKVQLRFKGREMAHQEVGREVVERFVAACAEKGSTEKAPAVEGRYMSVVISPIAAKTAKKS